jgi:hypothetical protein
VDRGGPAVVATITASGKALVMISALSQNSSTDEQCVMAFAITGGTTRAAADSQSIRLTERSNAIRDGATYLVKVLGTGLNTFTAQYRVTGGTCTWTARNIIVIPWPN